MIRISVEVSNGAARCRLAIQAESIERALEIARRHNPSMDYKVTFPIDPERFFVKESASLEGLVEVEKPKEIAA